MVPVAVLLIAIIKLGFNFELGRGYILFDLTRSIFWSRLLLGSIVGGWVAVLIAFAFLPFRGGIFFNVDCLNSHLTMKTLLKQVTYLYPGWHVRAVNRHERSSNAKSVVEA